MTLAYKARLFLLSSCFAGMLAMLLLISDHGGMTLAAAPPANGDVKRPQCTVKQLASGGASISMKLAAPGKVSLAVYDAQGRQLRTLLSARPLTAGQHTIAWDGLDRDGNAPPAGEFTVKLLQTNVLRSELAAQTGINPMPFWEEGVGNDEPPCVISVDPEGLIVIPPASEGGFKLARLRPDGSYAWAGVDNHAAQFTHFNHSSTTRILHKVQWGYYPADAVTLGDTLLMLQADGQLHRISRVTGQILAPSLKVGWAGEYHDMRILSMDALDNTAIISYRKHNALRWYNLQNGTKKAEIKDIAEPLGVAIDKDGNALVISAGAIVRVTPDGAVTPFISAEALTAPWRLSFDRKTGELLVAENSIAAGLATPHHMVKRFSPTGVLIRSYGRPEGRLEGRYVAKDFMNISDIAAGNDGGFVVAEPHAPPTRVAQFDADGVPVKEFFGSVPYGSRCEPEPDDPRHVWYVVGKGLVRAEIDYATKNWRVLETYHASIRKNPLVSIGKSHSVGALSTFLRDGKMYLFHSSGTLLLYDNERKALRPCNVLGVQWIDNEKWMVPEDLRGSEKPLYHIRTGYLWSDRNDDGMVTFNEMSLYNAWYAWGPNGRLSGFDKDFSMVYAGGQRIKPTHITAGGTPVYDVSKPEFVEKLGIGGGVDLFQSPDGNWYKTITGWGGPETHGIEWYAARSGKDRVEKFDADFNKLWSVGRHSATWDHEAGWSHRLEAIAGVVNGCVVADGNFADVEQIGPMVWTDDGLFVDELMVHPGGNYPEWVYYGSRNEHPKGKVLADPETGEVYFFAFGNSGLPIWRITGWEDWQRVEAKFQLAESAPQAARAGNGLQAEYFANPDWQEPALVSRVDATINYDWVKTVPAADVPQRGFSARWTGAIEAPLSEDMVLVLRTGTDFRYNNRPKNPVVRLWVNGAKLIDTTERLGVEARNYNRECWRAVVPMQAGKRYAIRLEYGERGGAGPAEAEANYLNLCWESPTLERITVASQYLYPDAALANTGDGVATPVGDLRLAGRLLPVTSDIPQTVQADGLLAHLRFDEQAGLLAMSDVGAGIHASLHGATQWVAGQKGNALYFADGGMCSVVPELRMPHTNYTVGFWFKSEGGSGRLLSVNRKPIFHNNYDDSIISLSAGRVQVSLSNEKLTTVQAYNDNRWHHVALVVEEKMGNTLYIDGQLAKVLDSKGQPVEKGKNDRLGTWHLWHVPTERLGLRIGPADSKSMLAIDDLQVFARPLSAQEVERMFVQ